MHPFVKITSAKTRAAAASRASRNVTLAALGLMGLIGHHPAQAAGPEPRVTLSGAASPAPRLRGALRLGRLDAATSLRASLVLPLRNQGQLDDLVRRQYTPGDPLFHHFLTPPDFTARFGPTAADYAAVAAYARAQGLTVTGTSPGRTLLSVSGPSARIEAAFGVQMSRYQMPDGRTVYANSAAPVLPRSVAVRLAGIAGLNNIALLHPHLRYKQPSLGSPLVPSRLRSDAPVPINGGGGGIGSGPLGGVTPNDIKYAYNLSGITPLYGTSVAAPAGALDGKGQNIGLFEFDGYVDADIAQYAGAFTLPAVLTGADASVTRIPLNNFDVLHPTPITIDGQSEVTLDIDMVLALAPAATGIYVYEEDQTTDASASLTVFGRMANDLNPDGSGRPLVQVISTSWGLAETLEDPAILSGENALFQQMAAQGQSLFAASGDSGAYDLFTNVGSSGVVTAGGLTSPGVDSPASQPFATGVGGTTLSFVKAGSNAATGAVVPGTYVGETVWSAGTPAVDPEGSGGGISTIWSKPAYQFGFGAAPTRRDVPDVSLNADPNTGYTVYVNGTAEVIGGTSAAAPLWAAYASLINEQRTANGLTTTLGFVNPLLYPLAASTDTYAADFHDIVSGTNLFFTAGTGYDDTTGLGSFSGAPLLAALSLNSNQGTGTATVTGTVTDSSTPPVLIAGATVTAVTSTNNAVVATATTNATGTYTLTVPSGLALRLTVTAPAAAAAATTTQYTGAIATLPGLTAASSTTQSFVLTPAVVYPVGLQMISAPYDYTGLGDFAAVFGLTTAQASIAPRLVQYSPLTSSYVFYPTAPADTLRLGQGYWVRFPVANYLHIPGNPASTAQAFSIPLQQGWNQIGDPFLLAVPLSSLTVTTATGTTGPLASTPAVVQATLYSFSTATNAYTALNPATDQLIPYAGDWIFAFQACTLSVPYPAAPPPVPL